MHIRTLLAKTAERLSKLVLFFHTMFSRENNDSRSLGFPLRSTADIEDKVQEILPRGALRDYLYYYNREYRKYGTVKELKKTVRLFTREEFAHKRALTLTLRKLADQRGFQENKKILTLLQERDIEVIERELIKAKRKLDTHPGKAQRRQ